MIVVEIIGGLGNQMFQYAFSLALKEFYSHVPVHLYLGRYAETNDNNGYELGRVFGIDDSNVGIDIAQQLIDDSSLFKDRLRRKIIGARETFYQEKVFKYDGHVFNLDIKRNIYFRGLWQDSCYFYNINQLVVDKFTFPVISSKDEANYLLSEQIKNTNSVSIHVRRGDYISNAKYKLILGNVCSINYYQRCIREINKLESNLTFFVFSDDISWVQECLPILNSESVVYVDANNKASSAYIDMQLMSQCKHNIIANSTFSWWGAWLNRNPNKKVFAPKQWFNNKYLENNHIIPDDWIKIENE